jgi:hypothetical protein
LAFIQRRNGLAQYEGKVQWFNNAKGYGFLTEGQYILVMLGAFKPMAKPSTGNAQADATTAMMESTAAMVQNITARTHGINFGFGIE